MAKSNSPAQNAETNGEVMAPDALELFNKELSFRAKMDADAPSRNRAQTIQAILTAETDEDFWNADDRESTSGPDLVDVEQRITGFVVKKSTDAGVEGNVFRDEKGEGLYLEVTSIRLDTGEEFVWNTSAPGLVAKIVGLEKRGMIPCDCVIRGIKASNGQVLKLKPVPRRAVPGSAA